MNLKVRLSQLKNELERREKVEYDVQGISADSSLRNIIELAKLRVRIEELEFLLGDLTKNFNKL